jgi:hypothetical protein
LGWSWGGPVGGVCTCGRLGGKVGRSRVAVDLGDILGLCVGWPPKGACAVHLRRLRCRHSQHTLAIDTSPRAPSALFSPPLGPFSLLPAVSPPATPHCFSILSLTWSWIPPHPPAKSGSVCVGQISRELKKGGSKGRKERGTEERREEEREMKTETEGE